MKRSAEGARALAILRSLQPRVPILDDESLEVWGPVNAYQYDVSGTVRIQQYMTVLVRRGNGDWLFLRQVIGIQNGQKWPGRPAVTSTTETGAQHWLQENRFVAQDAEAPAATSKGNQVLQSIASWFSG